jgi:hypothetical protein
MKGTKKKKRMGMIKEEKKRENPPIIIKIAADFKYLFEKESRT